jgi:hypothetical protein
VLITSWPQWSAVQLRRRPSLQPFGLLILQRLQGLLLMLMLLCLLLSWPS